MAHVNSHTEPRRAKMLDLANKTVKGSTSQNRHVAKQEYHQWERAQARRTYRHLRDFRCSGNDECDCPGCSCELSATESVKDRTGQEPYFTTIDYRFDDLNGSLRSAKKWARRLGTSDAFHSWLKRNYPDTLAGRHAIGHLMDFGMFADSLGCCCSEFLDGVNSKTNFGQCTCGAFLPKDDLSGDALVRRADDGDLTDVDLSGWEHGGMLSRHPPSRRRSGWAWRSKFNFSGSNLTGANLSFAALEEAMMVGTNLTEADLTGANLFGANLAGAILVGANLAGAILCEVDLTGADLTGANLTGADLEEACLEGTDLTRVKWSHPGSTGITAVD